MAIIHQIFAEISNNEVQCIRVCEGYTEANWISKCAHGEDAFAIDCRLVPCKKGDIYKEGAFYRPDKDGNLKLLPVYPDNEKEIKALNIDLQTMAELQLDLRSKLSYYELTNI